MAGKNKNKGKKGAAGNIVAQNRKARYDYTIEETLEAGILLTGTEVKSLRAGQASVNESYAAPKEGDVWLLNAYIAEYPQAHAKLQHEPRRPRKLLLHRSQAAKLAGAVQRKGVTLVPISIYFNERGLAKVELGIATGKRKHDKREAVKTRDWQREKSRLLHEKGNALFLVLIAVVLFGALAFTMTRSERNSSTRGATRQKEAMIASEIAQYAAKMGDAVERVRILNNCPEDMFTFENAVVAGYDFPVTLDDKCWIFKKEGGGMTWQNPPAGANDGTNWIVTDGIAVHTPSTPAPSSTTNVDTDLSIILTGMDEDVCRAINKKLDIGTVIPVDGGDLLTPNLFNGTSLYFRQSNVTGILSPTASCAGAPATPNLCGRSSGCFREETGGQRYVFYHVLLRRGN